jgi:two-component system, NtrC family, nitrogen regulation response regulator GlnG
MSSRHFLAKSARELGVEPKRLSPEALQFIQGLSIPGNVRQLENLCHWLTVLAPAQVVKVEDLPLEVRSESTATPAAASPAAAIAARPQAPAAAAVGAADDWLQMLVREVDRRLVSGEGEVMDRLSREFEAAVIRTALRHTHGRRIEAATRLGVGRNTITRKIQELGLED